MEVEDRYIPNRLRYHRSIRGYKLKDVAYLLNLERVEQVGQWERGLMYPNCCNLIRLCLIYRTFPQDLYPELFADFKKELLLKEQDLLKHFHKKRK